MTPAFAGAGFFRKPVPTPDQVRGRLFRDHARGFAAAKASGVAAPEGFARTGASPSVAAPLAHLLVTSLRRPQA